jgi:hypothetical protein
MLLLNETCLFPYHTNRWKLRACRWGMLARILQPVHMKVTERGMARKRGVQTNNLYCCKRWRLVGECWPSRKYQTKPACGSCFAETGASPSWHVNSGTAAV